MKSNTCLRLSKKEYFCSYYTGLHPTVFLFYEREAFYSLDGGDFRVAFDENIRRSFPWQRGIWDAAA